MAIREKLTSAQIALALVLQDPILMPEFLRNTKDGSKSKDQWPKRTFKYRTYQADLLSDKNPYIVLSGGRAIGKCQVYADRIYTSKGYKTIGSMQKKDFLAYAFTHDNQLVLRRARVIPNGYKNVKRIYTRYGSIITCTHNHPLWTSDGWKLVDDLQVGDRIGRVKQLPHMVNDPIPEYEARLLGYTFFDRIYKRNIVKNVIIRRKAVEADITRCGHMIIPDQRKRRYNKLAILRLKKFYGLLPSQWYSWNETQYPNRRHWKFFGMPERIMRLNEQALKWFLESVLARYGTFSQERVSLEIVNSNLARDFRELFLRFGIDMEIADNQYTEYPMIRDTAQVVRKYVTLQTRTYADTYKLYNLFTILGITIKSLKEPEINFDPNDLYRWDVVTEIREKKHIATYAVQVESEHTYITEDLMVHNSLVLEDKLLFEILNNRTELPETAETLLATANQNQLTPILDRFSMRIMASPLLKPYAKRGLNKQNGTMDFDFNGRHVRMNARITGSKSENNMIGLHLPRIRIDESQVFHIGAFRQLQPVLNTWEQNISVFACGVPNGLTNSTLYYLDQKASNYKAYRIPAPNNPYFTQRDYVQALKDYGGEESDLFQQLVLGRHGRGSEQVITRDDLDIGPHDFYRYQFTNQDKIASTYQEKLGKPNKIYEFYMAGIDTGFVDPTIIQVFGYKNGKWYLCARYRLQRIEYPEQELIIHWLHEHFNFVKIMIDLGSGGGGATILQSLLSRPEYKPFKYQNILDGITFNENIIVGYDSNNFEVKEDTKTVGANSLVQQLQAHQIVLSDVDNEGISEIERIARQKAMNGRDRYFILSENGRGIARNDHIFASLICFAMGIRDMSYLKNRKKRLGKSIG